MTELAPEEAVEGPRVGWYAVSEHPHYAASVAEAVALVGHGAVPIDDATATEAVAAAATLVDDDTDSYDRDVVAEAVADEAPAPRTRSKPKE